MEALDLKRIDQGKKMLLVSLAILAVLRALVAFLLWQITKDTVAFDQFDEIYWLQIPLILIMGAGTYQGNKAVRYILAGMLVIVLVLEIYLFVLAGFPNTGFMVASILAWLVTGFVLYLIMIDGKVEEFFLFQRGKNYGEYAHVAPANSAANASKPKAKARAEETEEAAGEIEFPRRSKKKDKPSWDDELDLFE